MLRASTGVGVSAISLAAASGIGSATNGKKPGGYNGNRPGENNGKGHGKRKLNGVPKFDVLDTERLDKADAEDELAVVKDSTAGGAFLSDLKDELGVSEVGLTAIQGITDNEEIEAKNATVVILALDTPDDADGAAGGLFYGVTGDTDDGERDLFVARAMIREGEATSVLHDEDTIEITEYAPGGEGSATDIDTYDLELPSEDEVTTQSFHGTIGTPVCVAAVATLCEYGGSSVTRTQCVPACTAAGPSGPVGYTACLAFCAYAVDVIQSRGCSIGASALCAFIFEEVV